MLSDFKQHPFFTIRAPATEISALSDAPIPLTTAGVKARYVRVCQLGPLAVILFVQPFSGVTPSPLSTGFIVRAMDCVVLNVSGVDSIAVAGDAVSVSPLEDRVHPQALEIKADSAQQVLTLADEDYPVLIPPTAGGSLRAKYVRVAHSGGASDIVYVQPGSAAMSADKGIVVRRDDPLVVNVTGCTHVVLRTNNAGVVATVSPLENR